MDEGREIRATYRAVARIWDRDRDRSLFEGPWLDRFALHLAPGARVLDLGCGAGEPMAAWLISRGFDVTGADFAPEMLEIAARRLPDAEWILADMRDLALRRRFAGIVAWNSFFHLTEPEQRAALPQMVAHLDPGGPLLFTCGPEAGERIGSVGGRPIYHASLSPREYRRILDDAGCETLAFVPEDPDCRGHTICLARKRD
ncbi:MAG: class I SAM-dependent methyltransferase [Rubricella sp.]